MSDGGEPVFIAHLPMSQTFTVLPSAPPSSHFSDPTGPCCDSPTQPAAERDTRMLPFNLIGHSRLQYPTETYQCIAKQTCYFDACTFTALGMLVACSLCSPLLKRPVQWRGSSSVAYWYLLESLRALVVSQKEGGGCSFRVIWTRACAHQPVKQEEAMGKLPTLPQMQLDLP